MRGAFESQLTFLRDSGVDSDVCLTMAKEVVNNTLTSARSRFCPPALYVSGERLLPSCRASTHWALL